ncbi:peptidase [Streptomyces sp. ISL-86]|uniref:peptidase n=1 Tax=Streptomyces sp. ISL-86 TaxID=2819187 RepID=UPI001BEC6F71|nr:peptidase [Streptomyces sp. ISL-86]MBT2455095.1 peptidase [Streptomyces sp. ISL-86]
MRKRISMLAACGLVAVGLATTPAHAAGPVFTLSGPTEVGLRPYPAQGGEAQKTTVEFRIDNTTGVVFDERTTFTIDLSAFKGVADVALDKDQSHGCTQSAASVTCTRGSLWTHESRLVALELSAAKDSKLGASADLTVTGKADGATFKSATTKVKVGGPDLVLEEAGLKADVKPGEGQNLPIVFANKGTESVNGVALEINTTHGIELVEKYDNCSFSQDVDPKQPWNAGWGVTVCLLDGEFAPDTVYEVDGPLTLKATPHAFIDGLTYAVYAAGDQPKRAQQLAKTSTGKKLALKQRAAAKTSGLRRSVDLDPWNNYHEFDFAVKNTADLVAGAVSLKGKAGETVKADFGFENKGPAWVAYLRSGEAVASVDIVIPQGATVTKVPDACQAVEADGKYREKSLGAPRYFCSTGYIVGETEKVSYPFELKIEKAVPDAKGSIAVGGWTPEGNEPQSWDPNHANNKAAFVINASGPTPTAGPTGTPSPSPSVTPSAKPSSTVSPSPSASTGTGAKPNGGLASTGSSAGPVALGAAVLVAAGGLLFVVFRRRTTGRA